MPADRDDPPAEAVEAIAQLMPGAYGLDALLRLGQGLLWRLRSLPVAARWRLIGWLAKGLEPTRGMRTAYWKTRCVDPDTDLRAMLTAARETSDAD